MCSLSSQVCKIGRCSSLFSAYVAQAGATLFWPPAHHTRSIDLDSQHVKHKANTGSLELTVRRQGAFTSKEGKKDTHSDAEGIRENLHLHRFASLRCLEHCILVES